MFEFEPVFYPVSEDELFEKVSEEEIYLHFFGDFVNDTFYYSPFRDEKDASFKIDYYNGRWVWRDFGEDHRPKDVINFIERKFNVGYYEAIRIIYDELVLGIKNKIPIIDRVSTKSETKRKSCKFWEMNKAEMRYWEKRQFDKSVCDYYNIYGGSCFINDKLVLSGYVYMFSKENKIYKGYDPNKKKLKFFSNNISNHIQNYSELSKTHNLWGKKYNTDILIVQKAYKEAIETNFIGYHSIAPHTESMFISPWEIDYLKTIFPKIYVFYDNDNTGITKCTEFTRNNHLGYINVPNKYKPLKDGDDIVVKHGYNLLEDIINTKILKDNDCK